MFGLTDVTITEQDIIPFDKAKHIQFVESFDTAKKNLLNATIDHLKLSGLYWCCNSLALLNALETFLSKPGKRDELINFIKSCECENGGYAASENHDPHILYTLSAIQICILIDALDILNVDRIVAYILNYLNPDGSFCGDDWGEIDTRFSFCGLACLSLLGELDDSLTTQQLTSIIGFILRCQNFDQGFGSKPGSESHAGQVYCCIGALAIATQNDVATFCNLDKLGWWLCERQLPSGGLNGRPEKLPDVCYSWWVLASLAIIGKLDWINKKKLQDFILSCQDPDSGGFTDRPGDEPDPFHTVFGISGLSLLSFPNEDDHLIAKVNPIYCMPESILTKHFEKLKIKKSNKLHNSKGENV